MQSTINKVIRFLEDLKKENPNITLGEIKAKLEAEFLDKRPEVRRFILKEIWSMTKTFLILLFKKGI